MIIPNNSPRQPPLGEPPFLPLFHLYQPPFPQPPIRIAHQRMQPVRFPIERIDAGRLVPQQVEQDKDVDGIQYRGLGIKAALAGDERVGWG